MPLSCWVSLLLVPLVPLSIFTIFPILIIFVLLISLPLKICFVKAIIDWVFMVTL